MGDDIPVEAREIRVLLVDDEVAWHRSVSRMLPSPGFQVHAVFALEEAVDVAETGGFDVFLVDLELETKPKGRPALGLRVCRELVTMNPDHVVFLFTAHDRHDARVSALACGAKGCIEKHRTSAAELALQLRSNVPVRAPDILRVGGLCLNLSSGKVTLRGTALELRPKERAVLAELMRNAGRYMSLAELARAAECLSEAAAREQVEAVAKKLLAASKREWITNLHGVGYGIGLSRT